MSWQAKSAASPAGYAYGPAYRPSWPNRLRAILYILAGPPRSLARDALLAMRDAPLPPLVRGEDNVPETGPFVVVANHYERPGLWMAWPALFLSTLALSRSGADLHWVAIEEWESFSLWGIPIPPGVTRAVFQRAFHTYGIVAMASAAAPAAERAASIRAALREVRKGRLIGLMPEGDVKPRPSFSRPAKVWAHFCCCWLTRAPRLCPSASTRRAGNW